MKPLTTLIDYFRDSAHRQNVIDMLERSCQKIDGIYYEHDDYAWRSVEVGPITYKINQWDHDACLETITRQQSDIW